MELKKFDAAGEIPFRAIVRAMPNLKDKQMFLKDMDERRREECGGGAGDAGAAVRGAEAEVAETESLKVAVNMARSLGGLMKIGV